MSDDLVQRLRDAARWSGLRVLNEAADRIEALEKWQTGAVIAIDAATTIGQRHGAPLNYGNHDRLLREALDA